jgi:uncharacterized phiE125 gp8 family phage protein
MALIRTAAPASLAEQMLQSVCDHLRVEADLDASPMVAPADLGLIRSFTEAAVDLLDGAGGMLRRALLAQTWQAKFDFFPRCIELVLPPIQSVTSIQYLTDGGDTATLLSSAYRVTGLGTWRTEIAPVPGTSWPTTQGVRDAVTVTFVAGKTSPDELPPAILQAIRLMVAHWYAYREAAGDTLSEIPFGAKTLLAPYKVFA